MNYTGVIFDLDGVICHTDKYHYQAWKKLADKIGVYFDQRINEDLRGVSREDSLEIILKNSKEKYSKEAKKEFLKIKNDYYKMYLANMTPHDLSDEVKKTLDELKNRNIKIAIGSSSRNAQFILKRLGLENYFDEVIDGNKITKSKPNPEVFIKAAKAIDETKCLVVEDAIAGVDAALSGGFDCAGINSANEHERITYKLDRFSDLLNILK